MKKPSNRFAASLFLAATMLISAHSQAETYTKQSYTRGSTERTEPTRAQKIVNERKIETGTNKTDKKGRGAWTNNRFWPDFSQFARYARLPKFPTMDEWKESFSKWKEYLEEEPDMSYLDEADQEQLSFRTEFTWADKAYNESGGATDFTGYVFGKPSFTLKEALGISALAADNKISYDYKGNTIARTDMATKHYLGLLADQKIGFTGSTNRQELEVIYQRLFMNKKLHVSVAIPFVRSEHKLAFNPAHEISSTDRVVLSGVPGSPKFYETYNSMGHFLQRYFAETGSEMQKTQHHIGIGDVRVGVSYLCNVSMIDRCQVGALFSFGSGKVASGVRLWEPETGNGGISTFSLYGNVAWHRGHNANPYIRAALTYNIPGTVVRRVPRVLKYDGVGATAQLNQIVNRSVYNTNELKAETGNPFTQNESDIRQFASTVSPVKVEKGFGFTLEVGNDFKRCFNKPLSCGFSYVFSLRQREKLTMKSASTDTFVPLAVTQHTSRGAHKIKGYMAYAFNSCWSGSAGGTYMFSGTNVPAEYGFNLGVNALF